MIDLLLTDWNILLVASYALIVPACAGWLKSIDSTDFRGLYLYFFLFIALFITICISLGFWKVALLYLIDEIIPCALYWYLVLRTDTISPKVMKATGIISLLLLLLSSALFLF